MIYKCPDCNAALEYNPATDKMECVYCGNSFILAEIEDKQKKTEYVYNQQNGSLHEVVHENVQNETSIDTKESIEDQENDFLANLETMECKIYTCTSCGAEITMNESEAATFCAYCGQPTIVFSRVSKELKPESIVLFRINKEQAIAGIREKLARSSFVPKEIQNFSVEKVRGIYIPYWVFDIHYYDSQHWEYTIDSGNGKRTKSYEREAECMFKGLTLDASKNLNDELSQRLEPFDVRTRKPFETGYLSGFYADRYDYKEEQLRNYAYFRAKQFFDAQIKDTIPQPNAKLKLSFPKRVIKNAEYSLLPAWFITFRYNYETYTIAVNGQNGKVVGTVPFDKTKVRNLFIVIASVVALFTTIVMLFLMQGFSSLVYGLIFLLISLGILSLAFFKFKKIKNAMTLTRAYETTEYVKERQDRE